MEGLMRQKLADIANGLMANTKAVRDIKNSQMELSTAIELLSINVHNLSFQLNALMEKTNEKSD